jgi:hypothetical protein
MLSVLELFTLLALSSYFVATILDSVQMLQVCNRLVYLGHSKDCSIGKDWGGSSRGKQSA